MKTYKNICRSLYFDNDSVNWHREVPPGEEVAEVDEENKKLRLGKKEYELETMGTGLSGTCVSIVYKTQDFFGYPMSIKLYTETPTEGHTLGDILVAARHAMRRSR